MFPQLKKKLPALLLAAMLLASFAGCGKSGGGSQGSQSQGSSQSQGFPVRIGDTDIPKAPQAVLSLSPGTTELLFAMGLGSKVVGVSDYCDYPKDEVDKRQRCGTALEPNRPAIEKQSFDLAVSAVPLTEEDLIWFQQREIPVLVLPRASTLEALRGNYLNLALAVMGNTSGKNHGEGYWEEQEGKLTTAAGYSGGKPLRAILLRELGYGMATGDTFEQELFDRLGLTNEAQPYTDWLYPKEEVAALEPEVIFADSALSLDDIKKSAVYQPVAAVKNNKLMSVPMAAFERQSPRMFDTLVEMAKFAYDAE